MRARLLVGLVSVVLLAGMLVGAYRLGAEHARERTGFLSGGADTALEEAHDRIIEQAVEPPGEDELVRAGVEGMLETLDDRYAEYYDAAEYALLNQQLDGTIVGIGVVLEDTETGLTVQSVLPDSPAEEVGLRPRDRIVRVDGDDVRDLASDLVVERVRGEEGTEVVLEVEREGEDPFELRVIRREIDVPNVETAQLPGDIGYLQLRQFTEQSGAQVRDAVSGLLNDGARGLVLDLRGNPGGFLPAAVEVAGVFIGDQNVVSVGADPESAREYVTRDDPVAPDLPLVLLVDGGSASASEIVAGAMRDLERAEIVGTTTFGKGTVQTILALPGEAGGMKLTTARYFTPDGTSIDGVGIEPDRVVEADPEAELGPENPDEPQLAAARDLLEDQIAARGGGG